MAAANLLEVAIVVDGTGDAVNTRRLDELVLLLQIEVVEVTSEQVNIGRQAYRDFGKGNRHPARLNFGDCFPYALAIVTGEALLFKGDDFTHTGIAAATP